MKKFIIYFTVVFTVIFFAACQKELRFEPIPPTGEAEGNFKMNTAGTCLPQSITGLYIKDTALNSSNFIEVAVDVTKPGWYKISTDTVAGMYFSDSGSFSIIQTETIILKGKGTPTSTGLKFFTIKFGDNSSCKIAINVTTAGGTTNPNAVFSITSCGSPVLSGPAYIAGTPVSTLNTVMLNVNVTNTGLYAITSNTNNGVTFTASGSYNGTGSNTIIFTANGTPLAAGTFNYTINTGTSTCTFSITVTTGTPPPPPANLDYIPQTTNTNWTTKLKGGASDDTTHVQVSANSITFIGNSYKIFEVKDAGIAIDSFYNRKNGGLYYQYIDGNLGVLDNPINKEYLVLDSNKLVGGTWQSANLGPNSAGGIPISDIRINAEILSKGTIETILTIAYPNVIKVKYSYTAVVFGVPTPVANEERWFAKGIGVIYSKIENLLTPGIIENELVRSQIN